MCIVSKRSPVQVANEDIDVYKVMSVARNIVSPLLYYPTHRAEFNIDDYERVVVPIDKKRRKDDRNIGYHCFGDFKEAVDYISFGSTECVYKFIIPKGAKYRRGTHVEGTYKSIILASKLCQGKKVTK